MNITIRLREVYGRILVYPVCNNAKRFAKLTGTDTLTRDALTTIADLGVNFTVSEGSAPEWLTGLQSQAVQS